MTRPDRLTITDCVRIAACAWERAQAVPSRSAGEYQTAQTMLALGADTSGRIMRAGAVL